MFTRLTTAFSIFLLLCFSMPLLNGCSSSGSAAVPAPADFSLTVSPATLSVAQGATGQLSVTAAAQNGLTGTVAVSVSGLPAGVTVSPSTLSLTPGTAQNMTVTVSGAAAVASTTLTLTGTAGSLTHTVPVTLAVTAPPPPPDFSLSVSPTSQTLTPGSAGKQVTLLATPVNNFSGSVAVTVSGLPAGVTISPAGLSLTPGASQNLSVIAAASAPAGAATLTITGTAGSLTHTTTLAITVSSPTTMTATGPDVTTYHYDNTRQGLNAQETLLTLNNVNSGSFGLLGTYPVDGLVDAAPLYVGGLSLQTGTETHTVNVVYVATEHDSVYALDAATGAQEWKTSVLGTGETPSDARNCNQIVPEIGITSTPVIDRGYGKNGAIFVVGMSKDASGGYHHRLHALDLTTGTELPGSPTEIAASFPGTGASSANGVVPFVPGQYVERAALTLLNGTIYMGWSSHCDIAPYTGWVMGYSEATLKQSTVLNLTPNGSDGSLWMSGNGLSADANGNLYALDANGTLDSGFDANGFPSQSDYGNAILKLTTTGAHGLAVADYFEPYNTVADSAMDLDLGSGGAMLLPDLTDSAGTVHHLLVGAGKDFNIYVGNRDSLGKFNAKDNSNVYQELPNALPNGEWGGPAYFNHAVYFGGVNDVLKAYTISNAKLSTAPTSQSATSFAYPGTTPSVSANGTQNGIVWALESAANAPAVLHAYDAANLAHELYNSNQAANGRDAFGQGNKFITPVVSNGMVFVGTPNAVAVFGLLGQSSGGSQ